VATEIHHILRRLDDAISVLDGVRFAQIERVGVAAMAVVTLDALLPVDIPGQMRHRDMQMGRVALPDVRVAVTQDAPVASCKSTCATSGDTVQTGNYRHQNCCQSLHRVGPRNVRNSRSAQRRNRRGTDRERPQESERKASRSAALRHPPEKNVYGRSQLPLAPSTFSSSVPEASRRDDGPWSCGTHTYILGKRQPDRPRSFASCSGVSSLILANGWQISSCLLPGPWQLSQVTPASAGVVAMSLKPEGSP
jgi:hypothetical protein